MSRFGMQLDPQCSHDLEDRVEPRAPLPGERFVEALTREASIARDLGHALGASNIAERIGPRIVC